MTRFVVDHQVLLEIAAGEIDLHANHDLVAPSSVRSQALDALYAAVRGGELDRAAALARLERVAELKMRLLNDRVSRRKAFEIAEQLELPDTTAAEFIAIAVLQADALVTSNAEVARAAAQLIRVETVDALSRP